MAIRKKQPRKRGKTMEMMGQRLVALCRELDSELDGVSVPSSAAAILNSIRSLLLELDEQ